MPVLNDSNNYGLSAKKGRSHRNTNIMLALPTQPESDLLTDDISYFAAIVREDVKPTGPSSLQVNLITTEILDAARKSIELGKQIDLPKNPSW
jgi:hypothetical protein